MPHWKFTNYIKQTKEPVSGALAYIPYDHNKAEVHAISTALHGRT
jgi:hypothetical protein